MAIVGRKVRVSGHVQGVFYRVWAQGQARELGISGWIRNIPEAWSRPISAARRRMSSG